MPSSAEWIAEHPTAGEYVVRFAGTDAFTCSGSDKPVATVTPVIETTTVVAEAMTVCNGSATTIKVTIHTLGDAPIANGFEFIIEQAS
jgi:hypothetical protein